MNFINNKTIYFLDRNIISIIKEADSQKEINDEYKKDILRRLKSLDCKSNIFTAFFSLFEGQHGRIECLSEVSETAEKEVKVLESFFQLATIDRLFVEELRKLYCEAKDSNEYKVNIENKINFLKDVNQYLYQPLKDKDKYDARDKIIEIQKNKYSKYLDKFNPVVLSALYCLYGNDICKKILKPKKDVNKTNYYNAVMDFQHFTFFAALSGQIEGKDSKLLCANIHCVVV